MTAIRVTVEGVDLRTLHPQNTTEKVSKTQQRTEDKQLVPPLGYNNTE